MKFEANPVIRDDAHGRPRSRGVQVYVSFTIERFDDIEVRSHITLVQWRGATWPAGWKLWRLQRAFQHWISSIEGCLVEGEWKLLLRGGEPRRAIMPIARGTLFDLLSDVRADLARDLQIAPPHTELHLSLDLIGKLPRNLPTIARLRAPRGLTPDRFLERHWWDLE